MTHYAPEPLISIIIPVYNGGEKFERCLESVLKATPPLGEIIVVADGDTDGSRQIAEKSGIKVIELPQTGGPARARNIGAKEARGDLLFFTDADVTIPRGIIEQIIAVFNDDPRTDALLGSYDDEPYETNLLSQYKNLMHHYVHQTSNEDASTFWTGCGAIRREVFLAVGGFDERYRYPSIEDIELGHRLKKSDYRIRLVKQIQVKHLKRWDLISLVKTDFFSRALPWTRLILKDNLIADDLNLKINARISTLLVYLLVFMGGLSFFSLWPMLPLIFCMITLLCLNRDIYMFFLQKRGLGFVIKTLPWHWFYFFYSGLAFGIGYANYMVREK